MGNCIKCGKAAEHKFRVLEVQTLHIRDFGKEHRVQALGKFQEYAVCADCAREHRERSLNFRYSALPNLLRFLAVLALGVLILAFLWNSSALRLLGLAAIFCGLAGIVGTVADYRNRRKEWEKTAPGEREKKAAWEALLSYAPKKSEDSDLTYIPVTRETLAMKNGDLMMVYDLLPEVAVKAYELIHKNKGEK